MRIMNFILPTIGARVIGVALSVALSAQVGLAAGDAHADAVGQVSRVQLTAYGIPPEGKKTAKAVGPLLSSTNLCTTRRPKTGIPFSSLRPAPSFMCPVP